MPIRPPDAHTYLPDIDGLRGIALLLVIASHLRIPGFNGGFIGVDVFFTISGFLITRLLVSELEATQTIGWPHFFARRARRLLPAAALVYLATLIFGCWLLLPLGELQELAKSTVAAALLLSNVFFYLTGDRYFTDGVSPLLHTWSLGVEEQFYLALPLFMLLSRTAASRTNGSFRAAATTILAVGAVASLLFSVVSSHVSPDAAYYLPFSRIYEFSLGVFLALRPRIAGIRTARQATLIGVAGLALILVAGTLFDSAMEFPGAWALVPCVGTALVIYSGVNYPSNPVSHWLSARPLNYLGRISYSWYLWHWPPLAMLRAYRLGDSSLGAELGVCGVTFALAVLTYHYVERPVRRSDDPRVAGTRPALTLAALVTGMVCVSALAVGAHAKWMGATDPQYSTFLAEHYDVAQVDMGLNSKIERDDLRMEYKDSFGESRSRTIFVVWGDSHASHLIPAVVKYIDEHRIGGLRRIRYGCAPLLRPSPMLTGLKADLCRRWNAETMAELRTLREHHDVRVIMGSAWGLLWGAQPLNSEQQSAWRILIHKYPQLSEQIAERLTKTLQALDEMRIPVLLVGSIPLQRLDVPKCLLRYDESHCRTRRSEVDAQRQQSVELLAAEAARFPMVRVVDPVDFFCDAQWCLPRRNGVTFYIDDNHLSAHGSRALEPTLRPGLDWLLPTP